MNNTYIIYWDGAQVGVAYCDTEQDAVFNFKDESPYYKSWSLSAFKVDIP